MTEFTKEYFIEKFTAIPDELWKVGADADPENPAIGCALFHLGVAWRSGIKDDYTEANALADLIIANSKILSKHNKYLKKSFKLYIKGDLLRTDIIFVINDTAPALGRHPKEAILHILNLL